MPPQFEKPLELKVGGDESEHQIYQFPHAQARTETNWADFDDQIDKTIAAGFQVRAVVVERKWSDYQRCASDNWGTIVRFDRWFKQGEEFKPIVCQFVGRPSFEHYKMEELVLIHKSEPWEVLYQKVKG